GEAEDRLLGADRVPAGDNAAGLDDDGSGRRQDLLDDVEGHPVGEGGHVEGQEHPPAHGEDVAAGIGGGDRSEVGGVVDERRKEVGGRDEGGLVVQAEDGGVV